MSKLQQAKKIAQNLSQYALQKGADAGKVLQTAVNPATVTRPEEAKTLAKGSALRQLAEALALPQKYASQKVAEVAGLKAEDTSEQNFANIADTIGDKLGVPRDSTAGNAVKAAAVAGAEVFADPLGFLPIGKVATGIKGLGKMKPLAAVAKVAEESGALAKVAQKVEVAKLAKAKALQEAADKVRLAKTATEEAWLATHSKPNLRPELVGKDTKQIWAANKAKQEAAQAAALESKTIPGKAAQFRDMDLTMQALEKAREIGVPESRQQAFVKLFLKNRGGGK